MSEIACTHISQMYEVFYSLFAVAVVMGVALVPSFYYNREEEPNKCMALCSVFMMLILFVIPTPGEMSGIISHNIWCSVSK